MCFSFFNDVSVTRFGYFFIGLLRGNNECKKPSGECRVFFVHNTFISFSFFEKREADDKKVAAHIEAQFIRVDYFKVRSNTHLI